MLTFEDAIQSAKATQKRQYSLENFAGERYLDYPKDNKPTDVQEWFAMLPEKMALFEPGRYYIVCRSSPGQKPVKFGFEYGSKAQSVDPEAVAIMGSADDRQKILDLTKELLKAEFDLKRAQAEIEIYKENEAALLEEIEDLQDQLKENNAFEDGPKSFMDKAPEWLQVVIAQAAPRIIDKLFPEDLEDPEEPEEPEAQPKAQGPKMHKVDPNADPGIDARQTSIYDDLEEFRNYGAQ